MVNALDVFGPNFSSETLFPALPPFFSLFCAKLPFLRIKKEKNLKYFPCHKIEGLQSKAAPTHLLGIVE